MPKYRYVGDHADFIQKGEATVPVAPGDFVELTEQEAEGIEKLIPATEVKPEKGGKSA